MPGLECFRSMISHISSLKSQNPRWFISIIHAYSVCITDKWQPSPAHFQFTLSPSHFRRHNHLWLQIIPNVAFIYRFLPQFLRSNISQKTSYLACFLLMIYNKYCDSWSYYILFSSESRSRRNLTNKLSPMKPIPLCMGYKFQRDD